MERLEDDQRARWEQGEQIHVEIYLQQYPALQADPDAIVDLIYNEFLLRRHGGENPRAQEYAERFPELSGRIRDQFEVDSALQSGHAFDTALTQDEAPSSAPAGHTRPPQSAEREPAPAANASAFDPQHNIGRYRVEKVLGKGGFGRVYLAYDDQLNRSVAIKVPHRHRVSQPHDTAAYLAEARILAGLDHAHIVPVFDVGSTDDGLPFVVSKFIEGSDLEKKLQETRCSAAESAGLLAAVAEALHYAHRQGLVHRDIKPGNILIDTSGKPYVADFGLALREEDFGRAAAFAGTPAYMSPEQARGEGHRVDGRSDIFSLGVVFYELLTGRRPFRGEKLDELLDQIATVDPRPPRMVDDNIPKELERICLKALAKRATERYLTAKDMADDLRHFLAGASVEERSAVTGRQRHEAAADTLMPPSDQPAIKIVPKGLRSFDAGDADFFLELLPGPRDRDGLPDSIRFWKSRIETTDPDGIFSVGLIYGPSGCGKSSLVKAGLLPRLANQVTVVYVEATAEETEARLLKSLRRQVTHLPGDQGLGESLAALRRGLFLESGPKVLLVLDQFEQWLHAKRTEKDTELVQALRQCNGVRVQCIVMVRDDFWMAATRFMQALEIRLVERENSAAVDLFDLLHARKVLSAFGRAYGRLPDNFGQWSKDQDAFLDQAVAGLAQEGKVISVRLALFAEMVKGRPWTPATLREVGGTEGVGVTFLEDTFASSTAPPQHRLHQKAAQAVLKALLPEASTDIKGHMRSQQELLEASGYASRPQDFNDLLRILDNEIRLITPTDPQGEEHPASGGRQPPDDLPNQGVDTPRSPERFYQLTHDYLVPSLRDWLTRKQRETRRGRAELRLAERAAAWNAKPETRHLPAGWEWASIRLLTNKKNWTDPQRKLMRKASRYHALRGLAIAGLLAVATLAAIVIHAHVVEQRKAAYADSLVRRLLEAETDVVSLVIGEMSEYRAWTDPLLRQGTHPFYVDSDTLAPVELDSRQKLHVSLALLPVDSSQVDYLYGRLLDAQAPDVLVIVHALYSHGVRQVLSPHGRWELHYEDKLQSLVDKLWSVVEQPPRGQEQQRLRAACALALYDGGSPRWEKTGGPVVEQLVAENPVYLGQWIEGFFPVQEKLLAPLAAVFRDRRPERAAERSVATNILARYAAYKPDVLADLLMDADEKQFALLYSKLKFQLGIGPWWRDEVEVFLAELISEVDRTLPPDATQEDRERLAKRQANAAVALLRMEQPEKVWPLLQHRPDPRVRSYFIHRLRPLGADPRIMVKRWEEEKEVSIRRALLLALGEFSAQEFLPAEREPLIPKLLALYLDDPDPGMHAATEWLLRQWKQDATLQQINQEWVKDPRQREQRLQHIKEKLAIDKDKAKPQWYVSGHGQTMVVLPGPVEFGMGSPPTEAGRVAPNEPLHRRRIGRTFAIAAKPVTVEQFLRFREEALLVIGASTIGLTGSPLGHGLVLAASALIPGRTRQGDDYLPQYAPTDDCPIHGTSWYQAAEYCNWLSEREGLPEQEWCYQPNRDGKYAEGMKLATDYLKRSGYRLPTEAEWEYACRAGAVTSRYYGQTEELLGKYGWYLSNSANRTWPVGMMKPNDFGLFDMHGNVLTWCQETQMNYALRKDEQSLDDNENILLVNEQEGRGLRGGSFANLAVGVRSAHRSAVVPASHHTNVGFRPARTLTP